MIIGSVSMDAHAPVPHVMTLDPARFTDAERSFAESESARGPCGAQRLARDLERGEMKDS